MLRIRFHGRGGQGMKTASRIVGTAAFLQGYYAQDSPVYGAERRGAPMIAFTRFDSAPVHERGMVSIPDLVVIADASLLDDPLVRPLQGLSSAGFAVINSTTPRPSIPHKTIVHDFAQLALNHTGSASALGVALAAAAVKAAGLDRGFLEQAVVKELQDLRLDCSRVERNVELARVSFNETTELPPGPIQVDVIAPELRIVTPAYDGPWIGTASVSSLPNTPLRKTGDWRVTRPVIDFDRCTHCWICFVNCPDGAITLGTGDSPQIDYGVCKGCLICAEECPIDGIESVREVSEVQ
jgi:pyruvate ferredoxin oxidoreductase gamma subunit